MYRRKENPQAHIRIELCLEVINWQFFTPQANEMILNNQLTEYSVVRVNRHLCNNMQGKKVIVILELEVLQAGSEVGAFKTWS
jgi:hypothetical protein